MSFSISSCIKVHKLVMGLDRISLIKRMDPPMRWTISSADQSARVSPATIQQRSGSSYSVNRFGHRGTTNIAGTNCKSGCQRGAAFPSGLYPGGSVSRSTGGRSAKVTRVKVGPVGDSPCFTQMVSRSRGLVPDYSLQHFQRHQLAFPRIHTDMDRSATNPLSVMNVPVH